MTAVTNESKQEFEVTKLNKIRRLAKRGTYDKEKVTNILREAIWCYIGFNINLKNMNADKDKTDDTNDNTISEENKQSTCSISDLQPCVIPTLFGHKGDYIYIHGHSVSRMLNTLTYSSHVPLCVTVALFDSFVLAKSAFHHSVNYKSVVIYGSGQLIKDKQEKLDALTLISDHVLPDRWDATRLPTDSELNITSVVKIKMEYVSAKQRSGQANDDKKDLKLPIWSGLLPINKSMGVPVPDQHTKKMGLNVPDHVVEWEKNKFGKRLKKDPKSTAASTDIVLMGCAFLALFIAIWKVRR